jgi:His-Xaa-Ser system protein HxsD
VNTVVDVDAALYGEDVVFRVAYDFTGSCTVDLARQGETIRVTLAPKSAEADLQSIGNAFRNALIDARLRRDIAAETRTIRELLIAQAFAESDLLDHALTEADYEADPRNIAR